LAVSKCFKGCALVRRGAQSFEKLAQELPPILNTDSKKALIPAIKALIPPAYHGQYDKTLAFLGTVRLLSPSLAPCCAGVPSSALASA
jgi:hypothetical protein